MTPRLAPGRSLPAFEASTPTLELNGVTRLDENRGDLAVSVTPGLMDSF
jgi:hypothetical protein